MFSFISALQFLQGRLQVCNPKDRPFQLIFAQSISHPCASTICCTTARPSPVPSVCVVNTAKNLRPVLRRNSRPVVRYLHIGAVVVLPARPDADPLTVFRHRLLGVQDQIEQRLAQKLFVSLNRQRLGIDLKFDLFLFQIVIQRPRDFAHHGIQVRRRAPLRADAKN